MTRTSKDSSPEDSLSGFFQVLAASFAHARDREAARSSPEVSQKPEPKGTRSRLAQWRLPRPMLGIAFLSVVLVWGVPLLLPDREVVVPDSLVGSWRSSARLYHDRGFTITRTSLALQAGPERADLSVHPITRLRIAQSGSSSIYTIEYLVEQAPYEFSFRVSPGPPAVISLIHQPAVAWRRE